MKKILKKLIVIIVAFLFIAYPVLATNTHSADFEADSVQYFSAADSTDLSVTGNMTIEAWVMPESQPGTDLLYSIVSKYSSGANKSYFLRYADTTGTKQIIFNISSDCTATEAYTKNYTLNNATWYHIAVVYTASAGDVEFYVNGSSIGTIDGATTSICDGAWNFGIGAAYPTLGWLYHWDGLIDEVRVWNVARTATQISGNDQKELNGNDTGLVGYYMFDGSSLEDKGVSTDPTGSIADDLTNNNTVTFVTTVPFVEDETAGVAAIDSSYIILFE